MGAKFFYRNIDLIYFVNNKLINNNLINQKDRILLSFSGGQDSICFVFILNQLYSQLEFDITFFWCHHLWQTDSFYLMQQIAKLSFLFQFNSCFPIPLNSISSELLARKWRQKCSYRVSLFYNYSKICLAHTFNDKVENTFLNFIRGTGLIGLAPLRWTQFISQSNITNQKHIFRHNYLNNSSLAYSVRSKPLVPRRGKGFASHRVKHPTSISLREIPFVSFVPVTRFSNSMRHNFCASERNNSYFNKRKNFCVSERNSEETPRLGYSLPLKGYGIPKELVRGIELNDFFSSNNTRITSLRSPFTFTGFAKQSFAYPFTGASLKPNRPDMCILQGNSDKLKNLTKQVIRNFIQRDFALFQPQRDVLYKSYKSNICTICNSHQNKKRLEQLLFRYPLPLTGYGVRGTERIANLTSINSRFVRNFVQIGKPGMFCIPLANRRFARSKATKACPEVSTRVTNKYKTKSCRAFIFRPTSDSSIINSCHTNYFAEQSAWDKSSLWLRSTICTISPKHSKELLNCRKGCYIVRPLLSISRIELNKICYFWKLPIYPDKSNQKVKFFRNRVRSQLLPTIKLFFNLNIENIFLQLAKIIETEDYCLTQIVNEFTKNTDIYPHIFKKK